MAEKEYIEREALVERLKKEECDCEWLWAILDIPAADVSPVKHGHWDYTEYAIYGEYDFPRCSECGFEPKEEISPYCPNCGAKMDGGEQE